MLMFVVDIVLNFRTALVQDDEINENPSVRTRAGPVAVRSGVLDHGIDCPGCCSPLLDRLVHRRRPVHCAVGGARWRTLRDAPAASVAVSDE